MVKVGVVEQWIHCPLLRPNLPQNHFLYSLMFAGPATYNVIRFNTGGNSINRHSIHRDPLNGLAGIVAPVLAGA
jgi:hypothetical protein